MKKERLTTSEKVTSQPKEGGAGIHAKTLRKMMLAALLAVPSVAFAGPRTDLPSCEKATEAGKGTQAGKNWAKKVCNCQDENEGPKASLDQGSIDQESYNKFCGSSILRSTPPGGNGGEVTPPQPPPNKPDAGMKFDAGNANGPEVPPVETPPLSENARRAIYAVIGTGLAYWLSRTKANVAKENIEQANKTAEEWAGIIQSHKNSTDDDRKWLREFLKKNPVPKSENGGLIPPMIKNKEACKVAVTRAKKLREKGKQIVERK